jgi:signal peptidase I
LPTTELPETVPTRPTNATSPESIADRSTGQPANSSVATALPRASRRFARGIWRWAERGFAVFGLLVAIWWLTFDISIITSPSMTPALQGTSLENGDRVFTEKVSYYFRAPRRWEVITFFTPEGEKRMKRVAGLPGENVQMTRQGKLVIDGRQVELPASVDVKYLAYGNLTEGKPVPCGDGYYVLGDDLKDSDDSRFNGPLAADAIIGRAWLILWPKARVGWVR